MSGYHCEFCGAIRHIGAIGYCCKAAKEKDDSFVASIIMRDPVQREGYSETRSNEKDEEELWKMLDQEGR